MKEKGLSPAVEALIDRLDLTPHPEGGFFRQSWVSPVLLPREALPKGYPGARPAMTSIYFLLPTGDRSRLHRVRSEELWLHHQGDGVDLGIGVSPEKAQDPACRVCLGQGPEDELQVIVPAGEWQTAVARPGPAGYALVGCVVSPGFDFEDFEMI